MGLVDGQDDRNRRDGRVQGAGLRHADLGDPADPGHVGDDDEPPRLGVAAAAGPAGDVCERVERGPIDRLLGELANLSRAAQGTEKLGGRVGHLRMLLRGTADQPIG